MDIVTLALIAALAIVCFLMGMITEHIAMKDEDKDDQNWVRIPAWAVCEIARQSSDDNSDTEKNEEEQQ